MKSIRTLIAEWNALYSDHTKLQHTYLALTILTVIVAGIIGLINYQLGQSLLFLAIVLALVFVGNGVVWALLYTFVIPRNVERPAKPKK